MGGKVPLGCDVRDRKLVVNDAEAVTVRMIFERFITLGSATRLAQELRREGVTSKTGKPVDKGYLYKLVSNPTYVGEAAHKGTIHPGEHQGIVSRELWDRLHNMLQEGPRVRANRTRGQSPALLRGIIFGTDGRAMSPTHTTRRGRQYRYYVSQTVLKGGADADPAFVRRVAAAEIERLVLDQLRALVRQPEVIVGTWLAARTEAPDLTEGETRDVLEQLDPLWDELFQAEQAGIVQALVERVTIGPEGADIRLRVDGLTGLVRDLRGAGAAAERTEADPAVLKALARAFRWKRMLDDGRYASISDIARAEKIDRGYVGSVLRLTLLAPKIVEALLNAGPEAVVALPRLLEPWPVEWAAQRAAFTG